MDYSSSRSTLVFFLGEVGSWGGGGDFPMVLLGVIKSKTTVSSSCSGTFPLF